jgi:hypothetical protein
MLAEMASYLRSSQPSRTIGQYLKCLYERYGAFGTENRYFFCYDPNVMKSIFDAFRYFDLFLFILITADLFLSNLYLYLVL